MTENQTATEWLEEFMMEVQGYEELIRRERENGTTDEDIKAFLVSFA